MLLANRTTLNGVPSNVFADFLLRHTVEGFFADPNDGGNKDMVGWRMLEPSSSDLVVLFAHDQDAK